MRTAPDANTATQFFTVTHPFHPWRGRRFELVDCQRRWGHWRVYYFTGDRQMAYMPAAWTDFGPKDPFIEQALGQAIARTQDLLQLVESITEINRRTVKGIKPNM